MNIENASSDVVTLGIVYLLKKDFIGEAELVKILPVDDVEALKDY